MNTTWTRVLPDVWVYPDSCNVYAVRGPAGCLIVDAGTGYWLEHLDELPKPPVALLCTHYFRDHAAGAVKAAARGIPVYVPEGEATIFADPAEHFRRRDTYIIYDNLWDLFAPIESVKVSGVLRDYDRPKHAGLDVRIVPLPGVTVTQVGLSMELAGADGPVIFCGEAIHSPGRLARVAPLQYNYNDFGGATNCYYSAQVLRDAKPAALLPSLGSPMLQETDAALAQLQQSLRALCRDRPGMGQQMDSVHAEPLQQVTEHVWRDMKSVSFNWYVISKSGKALALDYGYQWTSLSLPAYPKPYCRRPLLHGLDGLKKQFGIDRIDTVLISHFHDDHVCGVPLLQRLFGTQCWAADIFADLLEQPDAHCFPCDWPVPIKVQRRPPLDEPFQWEEYTFRLHPMNGHTRFSTLIGFEADGKRFAHTGDQYFFQKGAGDFANNLRSENHVYRNGALLDGYAQSAKWMREWRPDIVLSGHQPPMYPDDAFYRQLDQWGRDYREQHGAAMPLGDGDVHFNLDSWGGWIWPYRTHLKEPGEAKVKVTVRNPLPRAATLEVKLVGPSNWRGGATTLSAPPRAEVSCDLSVTPAGPCRRQPFAVELTADGQPFGQVAEALITVGGDAF